MLPVERLDKPLPKPRRDPLGYSSARALEALLESILALEFLEKGYTRNAAGKAFQAWRALTAALLAIDEDKIAGRLSREQGKWLREKAVPRVPTTRLKALGQLLEEQGHQHYSAYTDKALNLHDYQYHGPDPDMELSKYRSREEAAYDITALLRRLAELVRGTLKPRLERRGAWQSIHEEMLNRLEEKLGSRHAGA